MSWSTAGCHGSVRWARSVAIRSAAMAYCVRSLVPIDRKSTTSSIRSASSAADGTSTITPGLRPRPRTLVGERVRLGDGRDHRRHHPRRGAGLLGGQGDARRSAGRAGRGWRRRAAGRGRRGRGSPRPPAWRRRSACRSRRRGCGPRRSPSSAEGLEHLGVDVGLLLDRRLLVAVEEAELGAEQPDALDRGLRRRTVRRRRPRRWPAP